MATDRRLKAAARARAARARAARTNEPYPLALRRVREIQQGLASVEPLQPYTAADRARDVANGQAFYNAITDHGRRKPRTIAITVPEPVVYVCAECGFEDDEPFGQCPQCDV